MATEAALPVVYEGQKLDVGYRTDLVVEGQVVVELKSVDGVHPIHVAQLLSYMRLSGIGMGLLTNFNVVRLRDGIKRMVDGKNGRTSSFLFCDGCTIHAKSYPHMWRGNVPAKKASAVLGSTI